MLCLAAPATVLKMGCGKSSPEAEATPYATEDVGIKTPNMRSISLAPPTTAPPPTTAQSPGLNAQVTPVSPPLPESGPEVGTAESSLKILSKISEGEEKSRNVIISPPQESVTVGGGGTFKDLRTSLKEAGDKLVVIKFCEDSCEDCDAMTKLYKEFVAKYPNVLFLEANITNNPEAVEDLRIRFLPTFIAFKNHLEVGRLVDTKVDDIEKLIRNNI